MCVCLCDMNERRNKSQFEALANKMKIQRKKNSKVAKENAKENENQINVIRQQAAGSFRFQNVLPNARAFPHSHCLCIFSLFVVAAVRICHDFMFIHFTSTLLII